MAQLLLSLLILASLTHHSSASTWCVCREGIPTQLLQKTLDYACGAGADCLPIHQKGACFLPTTVRDHCSYAVNSFFQKRGQAPGTCDFSGTATCTKSNPSYAGCIYPKSASDAGNTPSSPKTPSTTPTSPSSTNTPYGYGPYGTTPPGIYPYASHGGLSSTTTCSLFIAMTVLFLFSLLYVW